MVIRIPHIHTVDEVKEVVAEAALRGGMIAYTLVAVELRRALRTTATMKRVIAVDLLGDLIGQLQAFLHCCPRIDVTGEAVEALANEVVR
jgi:regulator of PEP synthase PpsR (kinase-PPPase family)